MRQKGRLAIYAFSEKSRYIENVFNGIHAYPRVVWVVFDIKNGVHTCMAGSQAVGAWKVML
jgi:hypothetical protein